MDSWYRYRRSLMGTIPGILLCSSSTGFVQDAGYRMIGYRIQGRVQDTGFRIQQTGHRQDAGYRIQDAGDRIQDTRYRIIIQDIGYRIGYGIQDTGYRIQDTGTNYPWEKESGYRRQDTGYSMEIRASWYTPLVQIYKLNCFRNPDALDPRLCLVRNVR